MAAARRRAGRGEGDIIALSPVARVAGGRTSAMRAPYSARWETS
jgi:hypothetical protein